MSWNFSQELEGESSAASYAVTLASALVKSNPMPSKSLNSDNEMASFQPSQYGTTLRHSEATTPNAHHSSTFSDQSPNNLPSKGVSRAKIFPPQGRELELMEIDQVYGERWQESSVRYCRQELSWKTHQCLFNGDLPESQVILPKWGMMLGGVCWERMPWAYPTIAPDYGWLPTTRASIATHGICWKRAEEGTPKGNLEDYLAYLYVKNGGKRVRGMSIHPCFASMMMGFPIGHTDLKPLAMGKYQQWLSSHGRCFMDTTNEPACSQSVGQKEGEL